jgi:Na+/H+ antiporter NhaD/arsenite permease-like protein
MAGFVLHTALHVDPSIVALLGGGLLVLVSRVRIDVPLREVEWPTLVFFMGDLFRGSMLLIGVSALLSGIVDNIPYVATMSPVVAQLVGDAAESSADPTVLWWSLALGADLGGNLTAVGASANVVMLGIADRSGHRISFWQFTRYGAVTTAVTIALTVPYVWLRYFVLGW